MADSNDIAARLRELEAKIKEVEAGTRTELFAGTPEELESILTNAHRLAKLEGLGTGLGGYPIPFPLDALGRLTGLRLLGLSGHQLMAVPESLGNLTSLQQLSLSNNQLTAIPEFLGNLTKLQELRLFNNQLTAVPEILGNLTKLQLLRLDNNQLTAVPESLGNLTKLQELRLFNNQLTTVPESLGNLTKLQYLFLDNNRLTAVPESLGNLTSLQQLSLSNNQLTAVPGSLGNLTSLQQLSLYNNRLTAVPGSLGNLHNLERVYLHKNQLVAVPESLRRLTALKALFLHDNDDLGLSPEILGPPPHECKGLGGRKDPANPKDILSTYFALRDAKAKGKARPLNEAKLLIVGQGGVGKTSLVKRLTTGAYDPAESKTEGINRTPLEISGTNASAKVLVNVWDFGGQEVMHATHQFFLTQRSVYLIVLDARKGENEGNLHYWLRIIQTYGGDSPVIIVTNKVDGPNHLSLDESRLRKDFPTIAGFVKTSCASGMGIESLRDLVTRTVHNLPFVFEEWPEGHLDVKRRIVKKAEASNFLSEGEFRKLCVKHGVSKPEEQASLLTRLHDLGTVFKFDPSKPGGTAAAAPPEPARTRAKPGGLVVLDPGWITEGVYSIINDARLHEAGGVLTTKDVSRILPAKKYPPKHRAFIPAMMEKFGLCYRVGGRSNLLIPELLPPNEPDLPWETPGALRMEYRYRVLPPGLIPRFIVAVHKRVKKTGDSWLRGAKLTFPGATVLVRGDTHEHRVHITAFASRSSVIAKIGTEKKSRDPVQDALLETFRVFEAMNGAYAKMQAQAAFAIPGHPDAPFVRLSLLLEIAKRTSYDTPMFFEGVEPLLTVRQILSHYFTVQEKSPGKKMFDSAGEWLVKAGLAALAGFVRSMEVR